MKQKIIFLFAISCAACTSVGEVAPAGRDTYMIGVHDASGFASWSELKGRAATRANEYCEGIGKKMTPVDTETHGAHGWTPVEAEFTFQCLSENDPLHQRPAPKY